MYMYLKTFLAEIVLIHRVIYSGTCAIRHLSFPTSCDIRQKMLVPKYFWRLEQNLGIPTSCTIRHILLVPWCVGLDRFHCTLVFKHNALTEKCGINFNLHLYLRISIYFYNFLPLLLNIPVNIK